MREGEKEIDVGRLGMGGEMILAMRGRLDGTPERERALPQETEIEIGREIERERERESEREEEREIGDEEREREIGDEEREREREKE